MKSTFFKMPDKIFGIESGLIRMFFVPVAMVVIFLISLGLVIIPKIDQIGGLQDDITTIKAKIKSTNEKRDYLMSIDQDELKRNEDYLDNAVLKEKSSYLLVGIIRKISDKYGFQVKSFSISPGNLKGDVSETLKVSDTDVAVKLPVNLVLYGPVVRNLELVKALENSLPLLFIDKLDTRADGTNNDLEMQVSSYYVADKTDLVSGNLTLNDLKPTKEETDLLTTISQFEKTQNFENVSAEEGKQFVKYERQDPFGM